MPDKIVLSKKDATHDLTLDFDTELGDNTQFDTWNIDNAMLFIESYGLKH